MKNLFVLLFLIASCNTKPESSTPVTQKSLNEYTLINGEVVDKAKYPEIVNINTGNAGCTATVVGPKVVITASHCGDNGKTSTFTTAGKKYSGKFYRSSLYPRMDHDVALIVTSEEITDVPFATIGGEYAKGIDITIFGYGCTRPGGGGGNDGKLRMGKATVSGLSQFDMVSGKGAALCFGDSGGPAFVTTALGDRLLLGINSKGDIRSTNYNTRTDIKESRDFFEAIIAKYKVEICGVNKDCDGNAPQEENELVQDYEHTGLALNIPDYDLKGATLEIPVTQEGTLLDVGLEMAIEHTNVKDLVVDLVAPNGQYVRVYNRPKALQSATIQVVGMNGLPIDITKLDGTSVNGVWKLVLRDVAKKDEGRLTFAKLKIKTLLK